MAKTNARRRAAADGAAADSENVTQMPDAKERAARRINLGLEALRKGYSLWKMGITEAAAGLAEARALFTGDREFGQWCEAKGFSEALDRNERAALVMMGRDLDLLKIVLEKTTSVSIRLIYQQEFNPRKIAKDWQDKPDEEQPTPEEPKPEPTPGPTGPEPQPQPPPDPEQPKAKTWQERFKAQQEERRKQEERAKERAKARAEEFHEKWRLRYARREQPPLTPEQAKKIRRVLHPEFHNTTPLSEDREKLCTEAFAIFSGKMFELCGTEKP